MKTLAGVVRTTGLTAIGVIVGMQFLAAIGVNLAPLLASAGIAGVAIGLAAQNIVKDVLNGTLILVEDQFNVGDVVTVAGLTGNVESMTLRKTTVRGGDGTLYVVPNSQITTVANQSADFSVATINISVDFSANPNEVLDILRTIASEIRNSPEFKDLFVADPQILGVDALKGSQLIFPVVFKTKAQKQFAPMREFQRRVRLALEEHHMLPGDPMRVFNAFAGTEGSGQNRSAAPIQEHEAPAAPRPDHHQGAREQPVQRRMTAHDMGDASICDLDRRGHPRVETRDRLRRRAVAVRARCARADLSETRRRETRRRIRRAPHRPQSNRNRSRQAAPSSDAARHIGQGSQLV